MSLFSEVMGAGHGPSIDLGNTALSNATSTGVYRFSSSASDKPNTNAGHLYVMRADTTAIQLVFEDTTNNTYRRNVTGLGSSPSFGSWASVAKSYAVGTVSDTGGNMYGVANGGINMINIWSNAAAITKNMPQTPVNGDECIIIVTNGRTDNVLTVTGGQPVHGVTDSIILNMPGTPMTFRYFSAINEWRLI